jgi:hypothetical protein
MDSNGQKDPKLLQFKVMPKLPNHMTKDSNVIVTFLSDTLSILCQIFRPPLISPDDCSLLIAVKAYGWKTLWNSSNIKWNAISVVTMAFVIQRQRLRNSFKHNSDNHSDATSRNINPKSNATNNDRRNIRISTINQTQYDERNTGKHKRNNWNENRERALFRGIRMKTCDTGMRNSKAERPIHFSQHASWATKNQVQDFPEFFELLRKRRKTVLPILTKDRVPIRLRK